MLPVKINSIRFFLFVLLVHASLLSCKKDVKVDRPNVLLIAADDLGFSDLGCYGGEIYTPHLNKLARGGVRMTRFYTTGRCCPSRASLLTGQYPHNVGLGHMVKDLSRPGYRGVVSKNVKTIAEILKSSGYNTFLSGKWHLGTDNPTEHGFDEFYGTLVSAQTFWDPDHYHRIPRDGETITWEDEFYGTDGLSAYARMFLNHGRTDEDNPWFLYLAYNAPHFPLQARTEDIGRYKTTYEIGWDSIRNLRFERMNRMGILPVHTRLSPRSTYTNWGEEETDTVPPWSSLGEDRKQDLARRMAIYAAMIGRMDYGIGQILQDLSLNNELDNTLIIFLSDNGACAEWDPFGFDTKSGPDNILHLGEEIDIMGSEGTYHSVGAGWANVSNTPWRLYKHYNHEGGISSPFIVHWPAGLGTHGRINRQPAHLIDILPTILDACNIQEDQPSDTSFLLPGTSLLPALRGLDTLFDRPLFFEHEGNRAVMMGNWKLTALKGKPWELYNLEEDRSELHNHADMHPDIVSAMHHEWESWARQNKVTPLPLDLEVPYLRPRVDSSQYQEVK